MKGTLLSIGALAIDVFLESSDLPQDDGFALISRETAVPGGSAANTSVAAARCGLDVFQTGKIGDDAYGRLFRDDLIREGVNCDHLVVGAGRTTLHNYIIAAPGGRHVILANLGDAMTSLRPDELDATILDRIDCFYTDLFSTEAALFLAEKAEAQKIPIVYNMQCTPSFMAECGTSRAEIEQMLRRCSLLVGGLDSYVELSETSDLKEALARTVETYGPADGAVATIGDRGSVWCDGADFLEMPAFPIEPVDTTGAGDAFTGSLTAAYYIERRPRREALRFASAAAALKCLHRGPRSKAGPDEIERFLREQEQHLA